MTALLKPAIFFVVGLLTLILVELHNIGDILRQIRDRLDRFRLG